MSGIGRKWKLPDSSTPIPSLLTPLTTPFFDFANTLLTIPTATPSLVKTSLKTDIQGFFFLFLTLR